MQIPQTDQPQKYIGLYTVDFGEYCSVGYTADEVAELLESEEFGHIKIYKIYRALADGTLELHGVSHSRFQLESGMFFHCHTEKTAHRGFKQICDRADGTAPPCRVKLHLARDIEGQLIIGLIYPAEYEHQIGGWLADSGFCGDGPVDAGISQVERYYQSQAELVNQEQLWPAKSLLARSREDLLAAVGADFQR